MTNGKKHSKGGVTLAAILSMFTPSCIYDRILEPPRPLNLKDPTPIYGKEDPAPKPAEPEPAPEPVPKPTPKPAPEPHKETKPVVEKRRTSGKGGYGLEDYPAPFIVDGAFNAVMVVGDTAYPSGPFSRNDLPSPTKPKPHYPRIKLPIKHSQSFGEKRIYNIDGIHYTIFQEAFGYGRESSESPNITIVRSNPNGSMAETVFRGVIGKGSRVRLSSDLELKVERLTKDGEGCPKRMEFRIGYAGR